MQIRKYQHTNRNTQSGQMDKDTQPGEYDPQKIYERKWIIKSGF